MRTISESEWRWIGHAVHYIDAHRCAFKLATQVGDVVVSTVGDRDDGEPVDRGRKFETLVFRVTGVADEECGCPKIDLRQVETKRTDTRQDARAAHIELCRKWAARGGKARLAIDEIDDDAPRVEEVRALKRLARAVHEWARAHGAAIPDDAALIDALDEFDFGDAEDVSK